MRGKYIVFEGGENVGKTTQAARLAEALPAALVREPGGTKVGEEVRRLLLSPEINKQPETEVLLHAAQRSELARTKTGPALETGLHVVSDRSWLSSAPYQGAQGITFDRILSVNQFALGELLRPDLCILLDADPLAAAERVPDKPKDYYESQGLEFHNRIRNNFLEIGAYMGAVIIDALQDVDAVTEQIREEVTERLAIR